MAVSYTLISGGVRREWDGASIPEDPGNTDWDLYLSWLAEGNAPAPALPVTSAAVAAARAALSASDVTVLRCYEAAIAVPSEWADYRKALRAVITGGATDLPAAPAYPSGT